MFRGCLKCIDTQNQFCHPLGNKSIKEDNKEGKCMMMSQPKRCKLYMWKRGGVLATGGDPVGVEITCESRSPQFRSRHLCKSEMCT